jgi:hypothetical protein
MAEIDIIMGRFTIFYFILLIEVRTTPPSKFYY